MLSAVVVAALDVFPAVKRKSEDRQNQNRNIKVGCEEI